MESGSFGALRRSIRCAFLLCAVSASCCQAAELKIVGPATIPIGGVALLKLEGAKRGEAFDYFVTPTSATLVLLFDAEETPVGVINGQQAGSLTIVGVRFDAETKKITRSLHTLVVGTVPPVPPTPIPPEPTPPVVEGKRALLIIRESADTTPAMARAITALRNPPHSDYLRSKGHTLNVLDDDAVDADGKPSAIVEAWRPFFKDLTLPVVFIVDQNGNKLVAKQSVPATTTADGYMAILKANGG